MSRLTANFVLVFVAIIWGTTFVFQSMAMQHLTPFQFTSIRYMLGTLSVLPIAIWESQSHPVWRSCRKNPRITALIFLLGLWMFIGISLQQVALLHTSVANAGFLTSLYLPLVPILSFLIMRVKVQRSIWLAVLLSLLGSWLMSENSSISGQTGDLLLVISAFFWACHILTIQQLFKYIVAPFQLSFLQSLITSVFSFIVVATTSSLPQWQAIQATSSALLYSGVVAVGVGFTLQIIAQRCVPAANATLILASEAVFAAIAGWLILHETMSLLAMLGALCIFTAIILSTINNFFKVRKVT